MCCLLIYEREILVPGSQLRLIVHDFQPLRWAAPPDSLSVFWKWGPGSPIHLWTVSLMTLLLCFQHQVYPKLLNNSIKQLDWCPQTISWPCIVSIPPSSGNCKSAKWIRERTRFLWSRRVPGCRRRRGTCLIGLAARDKYTNAHPRPRTTRESSSLSLGMFTGQWSNLDPRWHRLRWRWAQRFPD